VTKKADSPLFVMLRISYWLGDRSRHSGYFDFSKEPRHQKKIYKRDGEDGP
jgi:hypothetical protein